jgi:hypothetical protein
MNQGCFQRWLLFEINCMIDYWCTGKVELVELSGNEPAVLMEQSVWHSSNPLTINAVLDDDTDGLKSTRHKKYSCHRCSIHQDV